MTTCVVALARYCEWFTKDTSSKDPTIDTGMSVDTAPDISTRNNVLTDPNRTSLRDLEQELGDPEEARPRERLRHEETVNRWHKERERVERVARYESRDEQERR